MQGRTLRGLLLVVPREEDRRLDDGGWQGKGEDDDDLELRA